MDKSASILAFIKTNGPIVPAQVNKTIGVDVLFASAMLAELLSSKKVKISKLKVGGSPLYFLPGQEAQLNRFAHKLGEKDKRTHDMLESSKVLDESKVDPLVRVSLRQIPDFAVPLMINHEGKELLFWKYFTVTNEEAEILIKDALGVKVEVETATNEVHEVKVEPEEQVIDKAKLTEELRAQIKAELVREMQEDIEPEEPDVPVPEPQVPKPEPKEEKVESKPAPKVKAEVKPKPEKNPAPKPIKKEDNQKTLVEEKQEEPEDEFYDLVKEYFESHNISILNSSILRKNSDLDLTISMPTPMGDVKYYCKAKSKKKINDGDLSSAYVQGQMKKMPILFLTTGDVTKKALELAQKEFTTMIIKKLDE